MILGDFNYSDIDFDSMQCEAKSREFLETVDKCDFTQHIDFPTHTAGTRPDLVLSSEPNLVIGVDDVGRLGAGDHTMMMIQVAGELPSNITFEDVPDWKNADVRKLQEELDNVDWEEELAGLEEDVQGSWDKLAEKLTQAQENSVPKKKRRVGNKPIWMNQNILRKKRRLWKTYKETKNYGEFQAYKKAEKMVKDSVRKAKKNFEKNLAKNAKKDCKSWYSYLKTKTSNRVSVGPLKLDEVLVTDDEKMADILNHFFSSVFTQEDLINLPNLEPVYTGPTPLSSLSFSAEKVAKKIKKLRTSVAPGPDKLSPRLLQTVVDSIAEPLSIIFTRSLKQGQVPMQWKWANVAPIYKSKGSKTAAGNYRPISLTCILCKVMESIVRDSIIEHLATNKLI